MKRNKIQTLFFVLLLGCLAVPGFAQVDIYVAPGEPFTISNLTAATAGSEYRWLCDGVVIPNATGANYSGSLSAIGLHLFVRQARKDGLCNDWRSSNPYGVSVHTGITQPQGGCAFTQPPSVGTFANFHNTAAYTSSATFVTLVDQRDNKSYAVVKLGARWFMAQNLNYQENLTFYEVATDPSSAVGSQPEFRGIFWCPAGNGGATTTGTRASCNVWGALYPWETAMMVDGKWSNGAHSSSTWAQPTNYGTVTTSGNTQNHGLSDAGTTGGRGICPPNWHVPTDYEWGMLFEAVGAGNYNVGVGALGADNIDGAGARSKANCGPGTPSDASAVWNTKPSTKFANDLFHIRVLPSGYRYGYSSPIFYHRGNYAYFWSSTAYSASQAWHRYFYYDHGGMGRHYYANNSRTSGFSVRCVMNVL
jgi:uncharacterized protein (TIGR02145 family)